MHLVETGQIILNRDEEDGRCGGESQKNERVPAAPSGDFSGFFFLLSGTVKVGYRCPTNPSPSHTTPETWAIFSHLAPPFVKTSQPTTSDQKENGGDSQRLELTSRCGSSASN